MVENNKKRRYVYSRATTGECCVYSDYKEDTLDKLQQQHEVLQKRTKELFKDSDGHSGCD